MFQRYDASSSPANSVDGATEASYSGSDEGDSSEDCSPKEKVMQNLSWNQLQSMELDQEPKTVYQEHGQCKDRIQSALKQPCCKKNCKRGLTMKMVLTICVAFWSLTKTSQDNTFLCLSYFVLPYRTPFNLAFPLPYVAKVMEHSKHSRTIYQ